MKLDHNILSLFMLLCSPLSGAAQESYLNVDFRDGLPTSFIQLDRDLNTPSPDMQAIGFSVGKGWIDYKIASENNRVACSTSWYSPSGTSDDWLITPAFTVKSAADVLRFRSMASDRRHRDGFAVYVSTTGSNNAADFDKENPLYATDAEASTWTNHSVSLEKYVGKTIRVAFVNNSTDQARLYLDDIYAGQPSSLYMAMTLPEICTSAGHVQITGEVYTDSETPINGFDVKFEYNGQTISQHFDQTVTNAARVAFALDNFVAVLNNSRGDYKATITAGGQTFTTTGQLTVLSHKIVAEESTGTWCGWCVRGIVAMETLARDYDDSFIGICIHHQDPMVDADYDNAMEKLNSGGYPKMLFNRNISTKVDPLYVSTAASYLMKQSYPYSGLDLKATYDAVTGQISTTTNTYFAVDADTMNYRLAYALIEDSVHVADDDNYAQHNSYADGASGVMGGYEKLPQDIPAADMWYESVARGYFGPFNGVAGSVPTTVKAMEANQFDYSFAMPSSVLRHEKASVVVMLVDKNNIIVNAEKAPLTIAGNDAQVSGTYEFVDADGNVIPNGSTVTITQYDEFDGSMPTGISVRNTTGDYQASSLLIDISAMPQGKFQCCYGNCIEWGSATAEANSTAIVTNPSSTTSIMSEWYPEEGKYASWTATIQLQERKVDTVSQFGTTHRQAGDVVGNGPKINVRFVYADPTGIDAPEAADKLQVVDRYNLSGQRLTHPSKGINILKLSDGRIVKTIAK